MPSSVVTIERDVQVPMRDGVVLMTDIYRPAGDGPWPVVVTRTPYDRTNSDELAHLDPWAAARHGLMAIVQDVRGRFASEGNWEPLANEASDGVDTITWAAALSDSTGRVGMWGLSYMGNVQWQAAAVAPSELIALAPRFTWNDPLDGFVRRGGAREHGLVLGWSLGMGFDLIMRQAESDDDMYARLVPLVDDLDNLPRVYAELPSGNHPLFARHGVPTLGDAPVAAVRGTDVVAPSLNIAGWWDCFGQGSIDNYVASADAGSRLLIGPWSHESMSARQGDVFHGVGAYGSAVDLDASVADLTFAWLAANLSASEGIVDDGWDKPVRVFTLGSNEWQHLDQWPPADAVMTRFFLADDEQLKPEADGIGSVVEYTYDPTDPVPTVGGANYMVDHPSGMLDQAAVEARDDVLVFTTDPLDTDLEVTGKVGATLTVETDGPTTDWVVRLCDVDTDGVSRVVADGIVRTVAAAGELHTVDVDMWSTSIVFRRGHRIRVQVTSSCFPRWDRNLNSHVPADEATEPRVAHQKVLVGGAADSFVTLSVVPAS